MARMRMGWREIGGLLGIVLLGTAALGAAPDRPIRMTVELDWTAPGPEPVVLSLSDGKATGAVSVPDGEILPTPGDGEGWELGRGGSDRARVRIEAPIGASLIVTASTGAVPVRIPLAALLEGPQRTAPGSPLVVGAERVAWDALEVRPAGDGTAAPGGEVPVTLGFNVLTPEPTEVALSFVAELRPLRGEGPRWRVEGKEVVPTDAAEPPSRRLTVPMPPVEGTYVLEVRASWEPLAGREGSWLARRLRRRLGGGGPVNAATRAVSLAVVGPEVPPPPPSGAGGVPVDSVDLDRRLGHRPAASGRSPTAAPGGFAWPVPEAALVEASRRDRLRAGLRGPEAAPLAPADEAGLAWTAVGLRVPHPGRPHRLALTVIGGHPAALGVALVAPGGSGPRLLLDACASGPPIVEGGAVRTYSWSVWPDAAEPVLVLVNRDPTASVRVGAVELIELPEAPPPALAAEAPGGPPRTLGVHLAAPHALDRFGLGPAGAGPEPADVLGGARTLAAYLAHLGATAAILPDGLADRARRSALDGQAAEDATGPDRLDLVLRALARRGQLAWVEVPADGPLPGLPAPETAEAVARGLVRLDRDGRPDGAVYHPLHPEVRAALARRLAAAVAPRAEHPNLAGVLVRLGPGPTLLGGPDSGSDDATYARFVAAMLAGPAARDVPGQGADDPGRFAARLAFLTGRGRLPWLTWRAREVGALYAHLAEAVRRAAPGAELAVVTPGPDDGPAGDELRRADRLGLEPDVAWRAVGLDLRAWPAGAAGPIVLRGVGPCGDDQARDLATSPKLDEQVAALPGRGLLLGLAGWDQGARGEGRGARGEDRTPFLGTSADGPDASLTDPSSPVAPRPSPLAPRPSPFPLRLTAPPTADGPAGDELLGHAVAALDARWVVLAGPAVAGQEERVRRFARAFRALPAAAGAAERAPSGVATRAIGAGGRTYLELANDTPYPVRLAARLQGPPGPVADLGRGLALEPKVVEGRPLLVLDLPPFGVAALRVPAPGVTISEATPYPASGPLQAQFDELSARLKQLSRGAGPAGLANPGFEPASEVERAGVHDLPAPPGWAAEGAGSAAMAIDPDRPHGGAGSLRLTAPELPASLASDPFTPPAGSALTVRAWLRAEPASARVRVRLEGTAAGRPYVRQADLATRPEWAEFAVRFPDVPAGGLDRARLRFEPLAPGRLWLDDLSVSGSGLSEPELNARRTLLAAMTAYRDKRYADFARLASSHRARQVAPAYEADEPARAAMNRGEPTALPPGRRLR